MHAKLFITITIINKFQKIIWKLMTFRCQLARLMSNGVQYTNSIGKIVIKITAESIWCRLLTCINRIGWLRCFSRSRMMQTLKLKKWWKWIEIAHWHIPKSKASEPYQIRLLIRLKNRVVEREIALWWRCD